MVFRPWILHHHYHIVVVSDDGAVILCLNHHSRRRLVHAKRASMPKNRRVASGMSPIDLSFDFSTQRWQHFQTHFQTQRREEKTKIERFTPQEIGRSRQLEDPSNQKDEITNSCEHLRMSHSPDIKRPFASAQSNPLAWPLDDSDAAKAFSIV